MADCTVFTLVSEDVYNRTQSWYYAAVVKAGVETSGGIVCRVEIRANAYEEQSHATVSLWGREGWMFHTQIPTAGWYPRAPSYTSKQIVDDDIDVFHEVRDELLRRVVAARWGRENVEVRQPVPAGCTGGYLDGRLQHDGDTCPVHEAGR